ncbi:hypothetical protein, partial [Achromobacter ruhlandii]|uniref:hypothetical protein n=1 Tax=Achromobacter ruhlandii TaxID=72557 RepID=UPI00236820B9
MRAPICNLEKNRNMLPFPSDTTVPGGHAAVVGPVAQPQTASTIAAALPRVSPEEGENHSHFRQNGFDNIQNLTMQYSIA